MKLPLDFGVKLFFRLLLPGFVLALGLAPVIFGAADLLGLSRYHETAFVLFIILSGWLVISADMPIYMLLEGRRYWPRLLRDWLREKEAARLEKLNADIADYFKPSSRIDQRRYLEASVETRHFPIGENGLPHANFPTRLGNAIDAFETYSDTRYGLDAIFYWPRIWVHLDKDTREEIDNQQAVADSAVYTSFAFGINGVLALIYCVAAIIEAYLRPMIIAPGLLTQPLSPGIFTYLPAMPALVLITIACFLLAYLVYRLAVFRNEQFGNVFMAVMDAHTLKVRDYLPVDGIVRHVRRRAGDQLDQQDDLEIAQRYLQYYRVKLKGRSRGVLVAEIPNQAENHSKPKNTAPAKKRRPRTGRQ